MDVPYSVSHTQAAAGFAELGNSHRLAIFRMLVRRGDSGASVGEIQQSIGIPSSTLAHHLARMAQVGLIRQLRHQGAGGRTTVCYPEFSRLDWLIEFLREECCHDSSTE